MKENLKPGCDMEVGPCSCGAWHGEGPLRPRARVRCRCPDCGRTPDADLAPKGGCAVPAHDIGDGKTWCEGSRRSGVPTLSEPLAPQASKWRVKSLQDVRPPNAAWKAKGVNGECYVVAFSPRGEVRAYVESSEGERQPRKALYGRSREAIVAAFQKDYEDKVAKLLAEHLEEVPCLS